MPTNTCSTDTLPPLQVQLARSCKRNVKDAKRQERNNDDPGTLLPSVTGYGRLLRDLLY